MWQKQVTEIQIKSMNKLSYLFASIWNKSRQIIPQRSQLSGYFLKIKRQNMTTEFTGMLIDTFKSMVLKVWFLFLLNCIIYSTKMMNNFLPSVPPIS